MAVRSRTVSVTTTATALNNLDPNANDTTSSDGLVYNDGAVTVFIGGANVTTTGATKGLPLAPTASIDVDSQGDDRTLYGIVATGTCNVIVLEVGVAPA